MMTSRAPTADHRQPPQAPGRAGIDGRGTRHLHCPDRHSPRSAGLVRQSAAIRARDSSSRVEETTPVRSGPTCRSVPRTCRHSCPRLGRRSRPDKSSTVNGAEPLIPEPPVPPATRPTRQVAPGPKAHGPHSGGLRANGRDPLGPHSTARQATHSQRPRDARMEPTGGYRPRGLRPEPLVTPTSARVQRACLDRASLRTARGTNTKKSRQGGRRAEFGLVHGEDHRLGRDRSRGRSPRKKNPGTSLAPDICQATNRMTVGQSGLPGPLWRETRAVAPPAPVRPRSVRGPASLHTL